MSASGSARRGVGPGAALLALLVTAITALAGCGGSATPRSSIDPAPYVHRGHVVNCDAFKSQADAQAVLRADTLDPNGLDIDGDGIACPTLPGPKDTQAVQRDFVTDKDGAPVLQSLQKKSCRRLTGKRCE